MINFELIIGDVLPGGQLNFTAISDDAENVSADFGTQENNLSYANGLWNGNYIVPAITALGSYPVIFSASDKAGNVGSVSVLYNVVASISPTINPGGTGSTTGNGSQSGSIGNGGTSSGSSGSTSGTSGTTGSSGSNSGTSTGGSSGSNSGGTSGSSGSGGSGGSGGSQGGSSGGSGGSEGSDTGGSFWDGFMNLLNQILDFIWKILPFILLAAGILMVAGFFFPALGVAILAVMSILWDILITAITLLLELLISIIEAIPVLLELFSISLSTQGIFNLMNLLKFISNPNLIGAFFLIMGILAKYSYTVLRIVISPIYQFFSQNLGAYSWSQLLDSISKYFNKK